MAAAAWNGGPATGGGFAPSDEGQGGMLRNAGGSAWTLDDLDDVSDDGGSGDEGGAFARRVESAADATAGARAPAPRGAARGSRGDAPSAAAMRQPAAAAAKPAKAKKREARKKFSLLYKLAFGQACHKHQEKEQRNLRTAAGIWSLDMKPIADLAKDIVGQLHESMGDDAFGKPNGNYNPPLDKSGFLGE